MTLINQGNIYGGVGWLKNASRCMFAQTRSVEALTTIFQELLKVQVQSVYSMCLIVFVVFAARQHHACRRVGVDCRGRGPA